MLCTFFFRFATLFNFWLFLTARGFALIITLLVLCPDSHSLGCFCWFLITHQTDVISLIFYVFILLVLIRTNDSLFLLHCKKKLTSHTQSNKQKSPARTHTTAPMTMAKTAVTRPGVRTGKRIILTFFFAITVGTPCCPLLLPDRPQHTLFDGDFTKKLEKWFSFRFAATSNQIL